MGECLDELLSSDPANLYNALTTFDFPCASICSVFICVVAFAVLGFDVCASGLCSFLVCSSCGLKDRGKDAVVHGCRHQPHRNFQPSEDDVNAYCHRQRVQNCAVKALRLRRRRYTSASISAKLHYANLHAYRKMCKCVKLQMFLKWYLVQIVSDVR